MLWRARAATVDQGRRGITYFAKEGLQGFVIACNGSSPLARHVGLYSGTLQGTAGPHQAQVCQPFLNATLVMQELKSRQLHVMHSFRHILFSHDCLLS